jgi:uncharacterized protein YkwD
MHKFYDYRGLVRNCLFFGVFGLTISCQIRPGANGGGPGAGSSRTSSVTMPIPEKLKKYLGPDKINAWSLSVIGGTCSKSDVVPVTFKDKFGVLSDSDVLINERITAHCAYTFVLALGKSNPEKTKLEKIYLTNDLEGKRTEVSAEKNSGGKVPVSVLLYFTADGLTVLGESSRTPTDPLVPDTIDPSSQNSQQQSNSDQGQSSQDLNNGSAAIPCYKGDAAICKIEFLIAQKTNEYRMRNGLAELEYDAKIGFVSRDWSRRQAAMGDIGHGGFPEVREAVYAREFGSAIDLRGENVAFNSCNTANAEVSASAFVQQWWDSPGHRRNMLARFAGIGVGIHRDSNGRCYGTQIFR